MLKSLHLVLTRLYQQYIPNVAVLFLFPVSCWSTYSGIRELMRSTGNVAEFEGLLISIGLTVGIQVTLLLAVVSLMRAPFRLRPLYLFIYAVTVFFSVLFGYAFYFRHLRADDLAREVHERESQRLLLDAGTYRAELGAVAAGFQELARYSGQQSDVESRVGGTCGDRSPDGRGPRARGRLKDAELFRTFDRRLAVTTAALDSSIEQLRADLDGFTVETIDNHHRALDRFYQDLSGSRQEATALLGDSRSYIDSRFPAGRYTIVEEGASYTCPDSQLEHLAGRVSSAVPPDLPPPPARFAANNPKVVVHHALEQLAGWVGGLAGAESGAPAGSLESFRDRWQRNLPLFLGLLVDCLIFLAAFSSRGSAGVEVSSLERLGRLEELPTALRAGLRRQLAALLGCSPASSLFAAYRVLQRYEIRRGVSLRPWVRVTPATSYIAVPRPGAATERWPELQGLRDLARLLESLGLAVCQSTGVRWSDLEEPLPAGLAELAELIEDRTGEQRLDLFRLDSRLMGDLVKEAFIADRLDDTLEEPEPGRPLTDSGEAPASV